MTHLPGVVKGSLQGRPAGTAAKRRPFTYPVSPSRTIHHSPPRRGRARMLHLALRTGSTAQESLFSVAASAWAA